jgi:hypothetical protein
MLPCLLERILGGMIRDELGIRSETHDLLGESRHITGDIAS